MIERWSAVRWCLCCCAVLLSAAVSARAEFIWVEGEAPVVNKMNRHPWWYDQVKRDQFSGGDFISNFSAEKEGEAEYRFEAPIPADYEFWVRANPVSSRLSYSLDGAAERAIDTSAREDEQNVAADGKPDLRFIAWMHAGKVNLRKGSHTIRFRMTSENSHHGYLDCFVFTTDAFRPRGVLKPGQAKAQTVSGEPGWFAFDPPRDSFEKESPMDLRRLNESYAGEHGFITVKDGEFIRSGDGQPLKFWAVNGPPHELKGDELRRCARMLAKHGVNMVRIHGGYFDQNGEVDTARIAQTVEIIQAMKAEGIYSHLSIYFPLWIRPKPDAAWLKGYDGRKNPFAALLFNPDFQAVYRKWWTALLNATNSSTHTRLADDPAVAGLEMQNEDSFFFWTFSEQNIPDPQLRILDGMFADWLIARYGSLDAAFAKWNNLRVKRDAPAEKRVGFRPLYSMFTEKTARDQDTAAFLFELQNRFYKETYQFLRQLGFKAPITASNWATASPEVFGPLEKWSYTTADFVDRHGYFSCNHKGENAEWSVREGHTYSDRSAYRFDAEVPGKPRQFVHPAMDPHYNNKPSMLSEITWNRPNRFRGESPVYLAAFGALQHSDAIVQFALDGKDWNVKPGYFMQPWTLMAPTMMGQFPATALMFRAGLLATGKTVASVDLNETELLQLKGTPVPQDASLDELRLKDVPTGTEIKEGSRIDPLLHYVGRVNVNFVKGPRSVRLEDTRANIDHDAKTVVSSTRELKLDYGKGLLTLDAPAVQGASGCLGTTAEIATRDLRIRSTMELAHIIAVALDGKPLANSQRILLQVMSEEKSSGFATSAAGEGVKRITSLGHDPWLVKEISGSVQFTRPDAAELKVTRLDYNGYPIQTMGSASEIRLHPSTVYYLVSRDR